MIIGAIIVFILTLVTTFRLLFVENHNIPLDYIFITGFVISLICGIVIGVKIDNK